jgi:hypothetical protein
MRARCLQATVRAFRMQGQAIATDRTLLDNSNRAYWCVCAVECLVFRVTSGAPLSLAT